MNKNELIKLVAVTAGLSLNDARTAVDTIFNTIGNSLSEGLEVRLVGFGTFSVTQRVAKEGRNPRTGQIVHIPGGKQPKFKAGKVLKYAVQGGNGDDDDTDDPGPGIRR